MEKLNWTRYWYSEDESKFDKEQCFLNEFDINYGVVKKLEDYDDIRCLILLGEPGVGKSHEIRKDYERLRTKITINENFEDLSTPRENIELKTNVESLFIPLESIHDSIDLNNELFDSPIYKEWLDSDYNLFLFLDSLDEARIQINTITKKLSFKLESLSDSAKQRLFLRIACRPAPWNELQEFQQILTKIWNHSYKELQLAPLTPEDVLIAAESGGIEDSRNFLQEIYNKHVEIFASDPTTLEILINEFKRDGTFPSDRFEIYEKGCRAFCQETAGRIEIGKAFDLTIDQRFVFTSRIASITTFSNKDSIWNTVDNGEVSITDISIDEIISILKEFPDQDQFEVTFDSVQTALDTRHFPKAVGKRLRWRTKRIAEFLSFWYLEYREISDDLINKLLGEKYLPPQLYELASLIASKREKVFLNLIQLNPLVLLRSDLLLTNAITKEKLVAELLTKFENEQETRDWNFHKYFHSLKHPNLAKQLKPYIENTEKGLLVRTVAIDIAESCNLIELQDLLADIAVNKVEDRSIRINAAYAVTRIAVVQTKARLKSLIYEDNDENYELKGRGLAATWNENLTAEELFRVLEQPPAQFMGSYWSFYNYDLIKKLKLEDLPVALDWISKKDYFDHTSDRIIDRILIMAWQNLNNDEIFEKFLIVAIKFLNEHHRDIFQNTRQSPIYTEEFIDQIKSIKIDDENRRKILMRIFSERDEDKIWSLKSSEFINIRSYDINWLVEERGKAAENSFQKNNLLAEIKWFIFPYREIEPSILDNICNVLDNNEKLDSELGWILESHFYHPYNPDVHVPNNEQETFYRYFGWQKKREIEERERNKPVTPSPLDRTKEFIQKFNDGDIESWWQINWFTMFLPNGRSEVSELEADLTKFPVWSELNETEHGNLIEAAKKYLIDGDPQNEKWLGTNNIHRPAFAGYRAISLLENFEPEFLDTLEKETWAKWLPIIYFFPNGSGNDEFEKQRQLIAKAYSKVPEKIIELLLAEIDGKIEDRYWTFEKLIYCWDERLKETLRLKLIDTSITIQTISQILTKLFELNDKEGEKFACEQIKFPVPNDDKSQELLILSAELLIKFGKTNCWEQIWKILISDIEFGKRIIESGVFRFGKLLKENLNEKQIADLFIWLSTQYPHKEDPIHSGIYSPSGRDEIIGWRDLHLNYLINAGTPESVYQLERIKTELSHLKMLNPMLLDAIEKMYEKTWQPLSPHELFRQFYLDNLKTKISKLNIELKKFRIQDRKAERLTKFRTRETWFLDALGILWLIGMILYFGYDGWTSSEILLSVFSLVCLLVGNTLVVWFPKYLYFSLNPKEAFEQDSDKLYAKNNLSKIEKELITQELEQCKRELLQKGELD